MWSIQFFLLPISTRIFLDFLIWYPPQLYLSLVLIFCDLGCCGAGKVILAASFLSGNIQAFCYGPHPAPTSPPQNALITTSIPSHLDERIYAWGLPSKVIAPQGTRNSWATILDSDMNFHQREQSNKMTTSLKRRWDRLAGLIVLPQNLKQVKCRGFALMQLAGDGDLLAQQFQAAEKLRSVVPQVSPLQSSNSDPTGTCKH